MNVLNGGEGAVGPSAATEGPEELGRYLQQAMLRIKAEHIGADGCGVDYAALASSHAFSEYVQVARQLVNCDPTPLPEEERMAFFISILNYENGVGHV